MSDNKKYYYIKLKENYFDQDNVKILESMSNGHIYSLIILKLYLKSCKGSGKLMMTDAIPYDYGKTEVLAKVIGHDPAHVREAIQQGIKLDLITITDSAEIWMNEMMNMIGLSSSEGDRKRVYRQKLDQKKTDLGQIEDKTRTKSGHLSGQSSDVRPPEIEIEIEIEKKKDIYIDSDFKKNNPDTYPSDDDIIIDDDPPSPPPIDEIKNSPKREFPARKTDPYELPHRLCNQFANEFNKRFGQAIGGHIGYSKAIDIFNNSPDQKLYFNQALEAIPYFFDTPDWYNTNPNDRKTVLWRKCTLQVFLANLPGIIAACQQDKKQQTEKPYDQMTHEEKAEYREKIRLRLEREGE